jgi:hypothetical protein
LNTKLIIETLLVLIGLTEGNPEIQKLVAFENAFEVLFAIMEQEGGVDGGIVVHDCLQLLANLLRYNSSNQVFQGYENCVNGRITSAKLVGYRVWWEFCLLAITQDIGLHKEQATQSSSLQLPGFSFQKAVQEQ